MCVALTQFIYYRKKVIANDRRDLRPKNSQLERCSQNKDGIKQNSLADLHIILSTKSLRPLRLPMLSSSNCNISVMVASVSPAHNFPIFNAKYRRKCLLLLLLLIFHGCFSELSRVSAFNCTVQGNHCQNEGQCQKDGQCLCADGWQGPECQFCGGKVR